MQTQSGMHIKCLKSAGRLPHSQNTGTDLEKPPLSRKRSTCHRDSRFVEDHGLHRNAFPSTVFTLNARFPEVLAHCLFQQCHQTRVTYQASLPCLIVICSAGANFICCAARFSGSGLLRVCVQRHFGARNSIQDFPGREFRWAC